MRWVETRSDPAVTDGELDGLADQFGGTVDAKFFLNMGPIGLNRLHAQVQVLGDLRVPKPWPISRNTSSSRSLRRSMGEVWTGSERPLIRPSRV